MFVDRRGGIRDPGKALEVWLCCWATVSLLILDTHAKNVPGHALGYARVGLLHVSAGCLPDGVMLWPQVAQLDQKPQHLPGSLPITPQYMQAEPETAEKEVCYRNKARKDSPLGSRAEGKACLQRNRKSERVAGSQGQGFL